MDSLLDTEYGPVRALDEVPVSLVQVEWLKTRSGTDWIGITVIRRHLGVNLRKLRTDPEALEHTQHLALSRLWRKFDLTCEPNIVYLAL